MVSRSFGISPFSLHVGVENTYMLPILLFPGSPACWCRRDIYVTDFVVSGQRSTSFVIRFPFQFNVPESSCPFISSRFSHPLRHVGVNSLDSLKGSEV